MGALLARFPLMARRRAPSLGLDAFNLSPISEHLPVCLIDVSVGVKVIFVAAHVKLDIRPVSALSCDGLLIADWLPVDQTSSNNVPCSASCCNRGDVCLSCP